MVDFAGWSMPVQYSSIVAEHQATRTAAALFDVSHMGRIFFSGPDAAKFLDRLVTRRLADLQPGRIRYGLVTNPEGGILDDVLVYHLPTPGEYQMVANASNREKIVRWCQQQRGDDDVQMEDRTPQTAMIAVQGPKTLEILTPLAEADLGKMRFYTCCEASVAGVTALVSRTGYTGEDGFELVVSAEHAVAVWEAILAAGAAQGAIPAGLASRDTLRLEAAMPLYGHELSEEINPVQAGLAFAVNTDGRDFIGREAIVRFLQDPQQPKRVGLRLSSRRVPREGYAIVADPKQADPEQVGTVTSGTFSPTLNYPIAMGYVRPEQAVVGTELGIEIRGQHEPATVVPLPFYKRQS